MKNDKAASPQNALVTPKQSEGGAIKIERDQSSTSAAKTVAGSFRHGKDEMNLVEHPFAFLKRPKPGDEINLTWTKRHPVTGRAVDAVWRASGDAKLGMPGPVEERLYLVLMELSREQGWPQTVQFSRGDVLRRLGLTNGKANYSAVNESFERLAGVRIHAQNSFWDARAKTLSASVLFSLLDEVRINPEAPGARAGQIPLALSSFKWSDIMHQQHIAGNVRSLHIAFALSLDLPLSTRLFRYLDKHKFAGEQSDHSKYEIELHHLCEIHLGMASAKYASLLKNRLAPAHDELQSRGFLADVRYEPMKTAPGKEKVVYFFCPPGSMIVDKNVLSQVVARDKELAAFPAMEEVTSPPPLARAEEIQSPRKVMVNAIRCHAVFSSLDATEQERLRTMARDGIEPIFWDRLEVPSSPMSLRLWDLVMEHHPERFLD